MAGRIAYYGNIVKDGLVLCLDAAKKDSYPGSGTVWNDISGFGNNGTLTNGPTFSSDKGGSIVFDGTNDFVTGSNSANFAFGTSDFTISYWMYVNAFTGASTTPSFVDLRTNTIGTGPGYSDYIQSNKFKLFWNGSDKYTSTANISTLTWYNIIATRQSTTVSVYINAILDGTTTDSTNLTENGFRLARNVNTISTSYLNGRISSILIYKGKALTASEVLQNYNATKGRYL